MKYFVTSLYTYDFAGNDPHPLSSSLSRKGFHHTDLENADFYLAVNFTLPGLLAAIVKGIPKRRRFLIVEEPKVVVPQNHWFWVRGFFGYVLELGQPEIREDAFVWPQDFQQFDEVNVLRKNRILDRVAMVVSKRFSTINGEQYSLRAKLVESTEVDTFGRDWTQSLSSDLKSVIRSLVMSLISFDLNINSLSSARKVPKNYQGELGDKVSTLSLYSHTLVVENSNSYHSEKLFHAFFAGCFPIYVGPNPERFGIPKSFFRLSSPEEAEVIKALEDSRNVDLEAFRRNLSVWLKDPMTLHRWSVEQVWDRVADSISSKLRAKSGKLKYKKKGWG